MWRVLILLVIIYLVVCAAAYFGPKTAHFEGGWQPIGAIVSGVYELTKDYAAAYGTDNVCEYLSALMEISADETAVIGVPKPHHIYYNMLKVAAERTRADSVESLIGKTGLSFARFLSDAESAQLAKMRRFALPFVDSDINRILAPRFGNAAIVAAIAPLAKNYLKWRGLKPPQTETADSVEIDPVGLISRAFAIITPPDKTIAQKLGEIDITAFKDKDPVATRAFVEKMRRDIEWMDSNPFSIFPMRRLEADILREENENFIRKLRVENATREQREREQREQREQRENEQREREQREQREREQRENEQREREQRQFIPIKPEQNKNIFSPKHEFLKPKAASAPF